MSIAREIVSFAMEAGSSDIHLEEESSIAVRVNSDIKVSPQKLDSEDMDQLLLELLGEEKLKEFNQTGDLDSSIGLEGLSRLRINAYVANEKRCLTLRLLPDNLPKWQDLGLPDSFIKLSKLNRGLVLCTGPTGSGKSTTLAAIVNEINRTRTANIITVEDPVEFIHTDDQSIVSHREVGKQTESFAAALKAALREDPDVILVGEMRDLETISLALTAAETGHLVFGTLHTSGAPSTINRIIDVFPPEQQEQIRAQISTSLKMVVTQRLLKTKDGQGRVGAFEIMKCTSPIQNLIREAKIHQIPSIMQTAVRDGMITMDKSLEELVKSGKIDPGAAKSGH